MNYETSNSGNIGSAKRTNDRHDEGATAEKGGKTRETARNWAWAHSSESYDWMDSHSIANTRDAVH